MLDPILFAEPIEEIPASDAQPRLERALRIINSRVHDLAVAGARSGSELFTRFQDQCLTAANRKSTRHRESYGACTNDNCIHGVHRDAV